MALKSEVIKTRNLTGSQVVPREKFSALPMCSLLDQLVPQGDVGKERKIKVTKNKKERQLVDLFMQCYKANKKSYYDDFFPVYKYSLEKLEGLKITNRDIQAFIVNFAGIEMFSFISSFGGMFVSALMEKSRAKNIVLNLKPIPYLLNDVGYNNQKNVTVYGGLGYDSFANLCSGKVVIHGNVAEIAGYMSSNDFLTINGDAYIVGQNMNFGNIIINGNLSHPDARKNRPDDLVLNEFPVPGKQNAWYGCVQINGNIYPTLVERVNSHLNIWQNGVLLMDHGKIIAQPANK